MKKTDKIIVGFLVSMGMFTAKCAAEYVGTLSAGEKVSFVAMAKDQGAAITVLNASPQPVDGGTQQGQEPEPTPQR